MLASENVLEEVARLEGELRTLCADLDPDAVPLPEAGSLWERFDAVERLAAGAKCRLARRVEESRTWPSSGARSAAEHLARRSGTTTGRARGALEASKALATLPEADAALARGELSEQQAGAIASAASADPSAEARLVGLARRGDLRTLREECARVRARAEDDAERAARLHRQRSLRTWTGADGSWNLTVRNTPEVGAELQAALAPLREAIFQAARRSGRHEPGEAYGADALAEVVRRSVAAGDPVPGAGRPAGRGQANGRGEAGPAGDPLPGVGEAGPAGSGDSDGAGEAGPAGSGRSGDSDGAGEAGSGPKDPGRESTGAAGPEPAGNGEPTGNGGGAGQAGGTGDGVVTGPPAAGARPVRSRRPDTKVIVLVDYEALKRGWAQAGETCEIAGVGPVPVATARSLCADAFGAALVTNGVDVFSVAHLGRSVTAHQRSALEARGYRCEVPGCGSTTALEIDHIEEWHQSFRTSLDSLAWHCRAHHQDKTHRGWRLQGPPGNRRWIPPGGTSPPPAAEPSRAEPPGAELPGPEPPAAGSAGPTRDPAGEGPPSLFDGPAAA